VNLEAETAVAESNATGSLRDMALKATLFNAIEELSILNEKRKARSVSKKVNIKKKDRFHIFGE